ncbi:DUF2490 domain-containing protein [Fulvivirgaceae bacterium BMA10]|uniref:DUF2490 domain-containing protein n=1 Tax=Splendidivirga corallicola TaxID=3051826 RepID=A0ABT8KND0_9BACT|nr:DUF2490 domain-containing protein [Fulvivirgaceae bacterium BMA10]
MTNCEKNALVIGIDIILVLSLLSCSNVSYGQNLDTRLWTGIELEWDISEKIDIGVDVQNRLENNLNAFDKMFIEPSLNYSLHRNWRIGFSYRFIYAQDKNYRKKFEQRISVLLGYKKEVFEDLMIRTRTAVQYDSDSFLQEWRERNDEIIIRNRLKIEYDLFGVPITPFISYEFFLFVRDGTGVFTDQWRVTAGLIYRYSKKSGIKLSYAFNNEIFDNRRRDANIFSIQYNLKL